MHIDLDANDGVWLQSGAVLLSRFAPTSLVAKVTDAFTRKEKAFRNAGPDAQSSAALETREQSPTALVFPAGEQDAHQCVCEHARPAESGETRRALIE
jgi:hypothetical protein